MNGNRLPRPLHVDPRAAVGDVPISGIPYPGGDAGYNIDDAFSAADPTMSGYQSSFDISEGLDFANPLSASATDSELALTPPLTTPTFGVPSEVAPESPFGTPIATPTGTPHSTPARQRSIVFSPMQPLFDEGHDKSGEHIFSQGPEPPLRTTTASPESIRLQQRPRGVAKKPSKQNMRLRGRAAASPATKSPERPGMRPVSRTASAAGAAAGKRSILVGSAPPVSTHSGGTNRLPAAAAATALFGNTLPPPDLSRANSMAAAAAAAAATAIQMPMPSSMGSSSSSSSSLTSSAILATPRRQSPRSSPSTVQVPLPHSAIRPTPQGTSPTPATRMASHSKLVSAATNGSPAKGMFSAPFRSVSQPLPAKFEPKADPRADSKPKDSKKPAARTTRRRGPPKIVPEMSSAMNQFQVELRPQSAQPPRPAPRPMASMPAMQAAVQQPHVVPAGRSFGQFGHEHTHSAPHASSHTVSMMDSQQQQHPQPHQHGHAQSQVQLQSAPTQSTHITRQMSLPGHVSVGDTNLHKPPPVGSMRSTSLNSQPSRHSQHWQDTFISEVPVPLPLQQAPQWSPSILNQTISSTGTTPELRTDSPHSDDGTWTVVDASWFENSRRGRKPPQSATSQVKQPMMGAVPPHFSSQMTPQVSPEFGPSQFSHFDQQPAHTYSGPVFSNGSMDGQVEMLGNHQAINRASVPTYQVDYHHPNQQVTDSPTDEDVLTWATEFDESQWDLMGVMGVPSN